jgi:hypothetical protein
VLCAKWKEVRGLGKCGKGGRRYSRKGEEGPGAGNFVVLKSVPPPPLAGALISGFLHMAFHKALLVVAHQAIILGGEEPYRGVKNTGILLAKIKKLTKTRNLVKFSPKSELGFLRYRA